MTTRAAIYARVSSDPRDTGRSVDEQESECRAYAARQGWTVARVFSDNDRSASRYARKPRPEYVALQGFLTAGGADVLVLWEGSRASRDLRDFLALRDLCAARGIGYAYSGRLYDLARSDDRFSTGLDALLAERESDVTRDRVLRAMRSAATAGRPPGRLLYGYVRQYAPNGQYLRQVIHEPLAAIVREAARRVAGGEPCNAVAADFNRRGIGAPRGGTWDLTQIRRLVRNPAYIAQRVHRGQVVGPGDWPPILDEETFYRCVSRLSDPARRTTREGAVKHLLTGIGRCGVCNSPLKVQKNRGFFAYLCPAGFHVSVKIDSLNDFVSAVVVERLSRPDALAVLAGPERDDDARAAAGEAAQLRARLNGFVDAAAAGELSPAALARIEARLLPEIQRAEQAARQVRVSPVLRDVARPDIADRWEGLPITVRREVVRALMVVRLNRTARGTRTFDPDRVTIQWAAE